MKCIFRIFFDLLIAFLTMCFLFFLWYFLNGSLEMEPAEEDQSKIECISILGMLLSAVLGLLCTAVRGRLLRKK